MRTQKVLLPLSGLLLAGLLITLSGCGQSIGAQPPAPTIPPGNKPDTVRIEIDQPSPTTQKKPVVTLKTAGLVQQLYATTYALPLMPPNQFCTMERGPHYTLTFQQGGKTLATVLAQRDGCRPVTIAGEKQDRQATENFWTQLDKVISAS
ncbi:MAG: hypothetical protein J2P37_15835 [Ktedonobacteraceae bacterium]|nr:hypothetical protein [Ktedonobacteraceae bacterium]MBO0790501.1 hypothetical protein [Ktedonobacteraceae bacterium]